MSGAWRVYDECPSCGKKDKFHMHNITGAYGCFSCDIKGKGDITPSLENVESMLAPTMVDDEWPEVGIPDFEPLGAMAKRYLADRGILSPEKFGLTQLRGTSRILIPYFGKHGKIVYWSTRFFVDDGKPKYVNAPGRHPLYVLPRFDSYPLKEVVFVEGVFDCIIYHLATGNPTVALGGKAIGRHLHNMVDYVAPANRAIMLDPDALPEAINIVHGWGGGRTIMLPHGEDPAECFMAEAIRRQREEK